MTDILLALYNGGKFLPDMIDSILAQTVTEWHLYIADDGSSDGSLAVAESYAEKYPDRITVTENAVPTGSSCGNFMGLLKRSSAEYVMFCDQDDVWKPDKTEKTLRAMKETDTGIPVLVHTELEVADEALNTLYPSFTKYQGLDPRCCTLNRLLAQNNVTGCTVMINRALADLIKDVPPGDMLMHDWWAALAAAAFGRVVFVDEPTIKYRQHGGNVLGAVNNRSAKGVAGMLKNSGAAKERINATYRQAEAFLKVYGDILPERERKIVSEYISVRDDIKPVRMIKLIKNGYLKQNFMSAAGQMWFC